MPTVELKRACHGFALLLLAACGGSTTAPPDEDPVATTLTLSVTTVSFTFLGQTRSVVATVLDQNGSPMQGAVTWSSNAESVATVTPTGVVRAAGNGSAQVTATAGALSETVEVTVAQVASFLAVVSGDNQDALAGTQVPDPLVAKVQDQGGAGVEGIEVTFTPDANSGSVDPTSATSGADGLVSTTWTLGVMFGPQRVVAAYDDKEAEFDAFAGSDTPTPDLSLPNTVVVTRADPSSLDSVTVRTTVRNQGDAEALAFRVALLVDGVEVGTVDIATLSAMSDTEVEFEVDPMAAGTRNIEVVVDADDTVLELNETNNVRERPLVVLLQQVIAPNSSISGLSGDPGQSFYYRLDVAGPTTLTVGLAGGTGDVDLWIEGGRRPNSRPLYDDCISDGPTMTETCQFIDADGPFHIAVYAPPNQQGPSGFSGSTLTVTLGGAAQPFNLELIMVDNGSASQDQAFFDAAARWNAVIIGDVPDYDLDGQSTPANACLDGMPAVSGVVDDVKIFAAIRTIDGPGGTLARAGPCYIRNGSGIPWVGMMEFDRADLDRVELDGDMPELVLHEMGHVLGIGTIWGYRNLLQAPSTGPGQGGGCAVVNPTADTHFRGELAIEAFDAAGGSTYMNAKVPVANGEFGAGCGSADGHWRESIMDNEMMTPFLNGLSENPLSAITAQSLADLGYTIDLAQVDAYVLPSPAAQGPSAAQSAPGTTGMIDLRGDIRRGPIYVTDPGLRIVRILR